MDEKKEPGISPIPYLNPEFINSPAARTIRMLADISSPPSGFGAPKFMTRSFSSVPPVHRLRKKPHNIWPR